MSTVRCGTASGYRNHQRRDEKPCPACVAAKAEYDKRWRSAPRRTQISRANATAQAKALGELKDQHLEEYRALYAKWRAEVMTDRGLI